MHIRVRPEFQKGLAVDICLGINGSQLVIWVVHGCLIVGGSYLSIGEVVFGGSLEEPKSAAPTGDRGGRLVT